MRLNEVQFYDNQVFPAFQETSTAKFFTIESLETNRRNERQFYEGEPLFETTIELSPVKTIHERSHQSLFVVGALIAGASIMLYWMLDVIFVLIMAT